MKYTVNKILLASAAFATLVLSAPDSANAGKLYKWVDDKGNISYQDQPPPKNARILSEKETEAKEGKEGPKNRNFPDVVVYTVENCDLCDKLITMLRKDKVPHIVLPLAEDRDAQSRILQLADSIIAPSIFIGDELVQANTEQSLKEKLEQAGFEFESE